MNNILLINRINPGDELDKIVNMSFIIAGMENEDTHNTLTKIIKEVDYMSIEDIVMKYNGIATNIPLGRVPEFVALLCQRGLRVFGVYEIYNN